MLDDSEISDERAFCMLHNIFLELREQSVSFMESQPSPAINEAIIFMRNNIRNPEVDFKRLANKNGICADSLRKRFKRETGIALHQYFIQLKINAAKSMLSNLSYNISDLANILGFSDQYYFSRLFKKKTGFSPLKYRNNLISTQKIR
jgi:transcriptional regulator GlxA family with amidase domain